jgi:hypothetical protein
VGTHPIEVICIICNLDPIMMQMPNESEEKMRQKETCASEAKERDESQTLAPRADVPMESGWCCIAVTRSAFGLTSSSSPAARTDARLVCLFPS